MASRPSSAGDRRPVRRPLWPPGGAPVAGNKGAEHGPAPRAPDDRWQAGGEVPGELTRIRDAPVPSNARCTVGGGGADHRGERGGLRGPPGGGQRCRRLPLRDGRGKGGLWEALAAEKAAEMGALAAEAARALGCEAGVAIAS